jgi:hypothetical protein
MNRLPVNVTPSILIVVVRAMQEALAVALMKSSVFEDYFNGFYAV